MALIKCPECGAEVSDRAAACIKCGCPLQESYRTTIIRFEHESVMRPKCTLICEGKTYTCKAGESVELSLAKPTQITIRMSSKEETMTVTPGQRYSVSAMQSLFKLVISAY